MTAEAHLKHRLAQADLITGVIELSAFAISGLPEVMASHVSEPPAQTLRRILAGVEASDLEGGARELWARADRMASSGRLITWPKLLMSASAEARNFAEWARIYGMGVAYQTLPAAERVTAWAVARRAIEDARRAQADAVEQAEDAVMGVAR